VVIYKITKENNMETCNCGEKTPFEKYHKIGCNIRKGKKFPQLYYNKEGNFIPAPKTLDDIYIPKLDEELIVTFKLIEVTDEEYIASLPEKTINI
jgi:hypothetical protein